MRFPILTLALVVAACGQDPVPRVGVVGSPQDIAAAKLAVIEAMAANPGLAIELIERPREQATSDPALEVAEELIRHPGLIAVVGHSNSVASLAASQVYNEAGVVQIAPSSTAPSYSLAGPFSFRIVPSDTAQAARLLALAGADGAQRIAVVYANDDYGRGLYGHMRPALRAALVFEAPYQEGGTALQFTPLGESIAASRPDLLLWLGRESGLGATLAVLETMGLRPPVLASDGVDNPRVYENADGIFTGVRLLRFVDLAAPDPALAAFRDRMAEAGEAFLSAESVLTYDATGLVIQAILDGMSTAEQLRQYLTELGSLRPAYAGLAGPIVFDSAGDALRDYHLAEVTPDGVVARRR